MSRVLTMVLAGGEGKRLAPLTADRAKPAVPFGGNYRLIDFALSNLVNANYHQIVVLTQYKSHSLDRHVTTTWRLSPLLGNYVTPVPAQMRLGPRWFVGSADAIYQNYNLIADEKPGAHHRVRRRPHLPDGPAPDGRAAHRQRQGRDGRGAARADRAGRPVRRDRDRAERARHRALPREAQGRDRAARRARRGLRVDGQLRLLDRGADQHGVGRRQRRRLQARHRRQHHPGAGGPERRAGLRLLDQRGAGRDRARPRLLARRRDARRLLRRAHGPDLGRSDLQHVQPRVADPHVARDHPAGEVRVRRGGPPRAGAGLDGVRRRRHLGRHRAALAPVAAHARALVLAGRGLDPDARRPRSAAARSCGRRSSTRTW